MKTYRISEEELENYKLCRCVDCSSEYEKGLETSIDELENENQQLKHKLKVAEKALELACNIFAENDKAYKAKTKWKTPQQHMKILKEKAEKELKGEENE